MSQKQFRTSEWANEWVKLQKLSYGIKKKEDDLSSKKPRGA